MLLGADGLFESFPKGKETARSHSSSDWFRRDPPERFSVS